MGRLPPLPCRRRAHEPLWHRSSKSVRRSSRAVGRRQKRTFRIVLPCGVVILGSAAIHELTAAFPSTGSISTNGSGECVHQRGLDPVRVIVCHWSRTRPVLRRKGKVSLVAPRGAGGSGATNCARSGGEKAAGVKKSLLVRQLRPRVPATSPDRARHMTHPKVPRAHRYRSRAVRRFQTPTALHAREKCRPGSW